MDGVLADYFESKSSIQKIEKMCKIVANPQSKITIDNLLRTRDQRGLASTKENHSSTKNKIFSGVGKNEVDLFAAQKNSIEKIQKR